MKKSMYRWRFFLAAVVILAGAGIWIIQKKSGTFVPATEVSLKGPYGTLTLQLPEEWTYEIQTEKQDTVYGIRFYWGEDKENKVLVKYEKDYPGDPERMRMFLKQYIKEMSQLGIDSIGIVLLISFFIGAVICIQMKLNIQSPWMPRWVSGYTTREIMLLEFSSSIMCLILAGKVGSNIASELGTMRVTQQIDALDIMGVNSACYLILPKIIGLVTIMPFLVIFSSGMGIIGAYGTAYIGHILPPDDLTLGLQHSFNQWFVWMSIIKSLFFAFIISSVSSYFGYTVEGGSVEVGKSSTDAVVCSSVLILFSDVFLTQILS